MSNFDDFIDGEPDVTLRAMLAFSEYVKAHHGTKVALEDAFSQFDTMAGEPLDDDASPREIIEAVREREKHTTDLVFYMSIVSAKLDYERSTLGRLATALTDVLNEAEKHEG